MFNRNFKGGFVIAAAVFVLSSAARNAEATIVEFQTSLGSFQVNLFDNDTPLTVTNFLDYVNNGAYSNAIIHRSVVGFIIQGGWLASDANSAIVDIPANAAVNNEPEFSNLRGTVAMAKVGGDPNSATNQWFFNLGNNSANLDQQNDGFTTFGQVIDNGMDVVDAIGALPVYNFGGALTEMPLREYSQTDFDNQVAPDDSNFVVINAVVVTDTTVDSAAGLNPTPNTLINSGGNGGNAGNGGGGGGGGLGLLTLLALLPAVRRLVAD